MAIITTMTTAHAQAVYALDRACFTSEVWSLAQILKEADPALSPNSLTLVALESEKVVGFLNAWKIAGECDLNNLAVAATHRRQGIAFQLMQAFLTDCRQTGIASVTLEVRRSNASAIALYEQFGFSPIGVRKDFYLDPREDAILYRFAW